MSPKCRLKGLRTRIDQRSCTEERVAARWRNLTKESVEQTTFQSIDAASPVPPYAPGVRLFLAGRRGLATGHPPGTGNYTGKPRGAAGVRKHVSPLSRPGTRTTQVPLSAGSATSKQVRRVGGLGNFRCRTRKARAWNRRVEPPLKDFTPELLSHVAMHPEDTPQNPPGPMP